MMIIEKWMSNESIYDTYILHINMESSQGTRPNISMITEKYILGLYIFSKNVTENKLVLL